MKTFQDFWQSQWSEFKALRPHKLIFFILFFCTFMAHAKVGILEALQKIAKNEKGLMQNLYSVAEKKVKLYDDFKNSKEIKIAPLFLKSIFLNSGPRYLEMSKKDTCKFYSLLENYLLKTSLGVIRDIIITYPGPSSPEKKENETSLELGLMPVPDFLKLNYDLKCSNYKDLAELFTPKNIIKTSKKLNFLVPKQESDCQKILNDWSLNLYLPYLCRLSDLVKQGERAKQAKQSLKVDQMRKKRQLGRLIRRGDKYQKLLTYFQLSYIENICLNINSPKRFCHRYLAQDTWSQVINGARPKYLLKYRCQLILKKNILSKEDYEQCTRKLLANNNSCQVKGAKEFPAYFPKKTCSEVSKSLAVARLKTRYQDCPGLLGNEAITNAYRLISHIEGQKKQLTERPKRKRCMDASIEKFYHLREKHIKQWPLKICYQNTFQEQKECVNYFPGSSGHPDAESRVIGKIVETHKAGAKNTRCIFIEKGQYNPKRLRYKSGCFLVYDRQNCTSFNCSKKVINDQTEIKDIKYTGQLLFDFLPNSFKNEFKSVAYILSNHYKFPLKTLKNLTEITHFMGLNTKNILYGMGCVEDLLPQIYAYPSLNSCTPMPFIVDGVLKSNGNTHFVTRSAIDDIHSPRTINWNRVFNSVRSFQEKHSLKLWALYGFSSR